MKKDNINNKIIVSLMIICSGLMALPSIIYLIKNKTIYNFVWLRTYFFRMPLSQIEKFLNALIFFILFSSLFFIYLYIFKNYKKIFKNTKQIFMFIFIVAVLFTIIIPYTSSDIYSYIANGWSAANYKENPYYVSTGEITNKYQVMDEMFRKVANCWRYETVVYGPIWTLVCTILSYLSFGNINIALMVFKIVNLIVHIVNCILIYKITKKKQFTILYGLNPFILFEALSNVHNDIFIICFVLFAIYFTVRKRNLFLSVACIAIATGVKYLAILILPFLVIYYVRKMDIQKRITYCILSGIEFILIIGLFYAIYVKDFKVLSGLFLQQTKYNRSILFVLYWFLKDTNMQIVKCVQNIIFILFVIYYIYIVVRLLCQKEIMFYEVIKKYHIIIMLFTFVVITNFNPWYVMWLFPTMFWVSSNSLNNIINLSYVSQIGNIVGFALWSEEEWLGLPYFALLVVLTLTLNKMKDEKIINERKN